MAEKRERLVLALVVVSLAALGGWALFGRALPAPEPSLESVAAREVEPDARATRSPRPSARRAPPATGPAARSCASAPSEERCREGDVWLVDGCGAPEEKLEECEERLCHEGACDVPDEHCDEPPEGRCLGDVVRLCLGGRLRQIDCSAQGMRCVFGDEGAACAPPVPAAERCREPPHCEGEVLVGCREGRIVRTDCQAVRARCLKLPGAQLPHCVEVLPVDPAQRDCGPCGCPVAQGVAETQCDGRDEDGDRLIDEGLACEPIPVVVTLVTDVTGSASYAREDVEAELLRMNRVLASDGEDPSLSLVLDEVRMLGEPALLELDDTEVQRLADDPRVHPARGGFYVPLVFTDRIMLGGTPKAGVSTLPNGTCGGLQEGFGPEHGIIALAKERSPTTAVHELGHFLGLCHTHDRQESAPLRAALDPRGSLAACSPSCRGEGDGLCDTPPDPGPEQCEYEPSCRTVCRVPADPDAENLMSYYTLCRTRFSAEQRALMLHTLALRRAWHPCLYGRCTCKLGATTDCPLGMTCRPGVLTSGEQVARCGLDGPARPGARCDGSEACGEGAVCVTLREGGASRCARPCIGSSPGCQCTKAGDLSFCIEDLR